MKTEIFYAMDEPDAITPALDMFNVIAKEEYEKRSEKPGLDITRCPTLAQSMEFKCDNFPQGMYLWRDDRLIVMFTIVRDSRNWSVCVFNDLRTDDGEVT